MANTLKFGNGNWATKEDSVLAYNDENNNFKPLPFDFTRASTATYVDSDGLIKTARNGEARIDYTDSTDGALLLEPARTNLFTYSELFSDSSWIKSQATATLTSEISPSGTTNNVYNYVGNSSNIYTTSQAINIEYTISCYAKSNGQGKDTFKLRLGNDRSGVFTATSEWKKYSFTSTPTTSVFSISSNALLDADILIWGAQLEAGSYATSYIPTSGSTVTRVAETCSGAGNEQVFNSSEGVLYAEISALADDSTDRYILLSDGGWNNRVQLNFENVSNTIEARFFVNTLPQFDTSFLLTDITTFGKFAIKWKVNDFALWVNGVEVSTDTNGSVPSANTFNELSFYDGQGSNPFYGNTKEIAVFKKALTDSELESLTSWDSFTEMATGQLYTIK